MAKQDAMVSGAGWIGSFASKLAKALRKKGVSNDEIHELVKDGEAPDALVEKVASVLAEIVQHAKNIFRVVVDYSMTLEQMVAAGRYDWKNSDVTENHFPIPPSKRGKGKEEVAIEFVHFNRDMESDDVLRELDKVGLRPAELPELLAFGATYPEKQREFPIVALGSVRQYWHGYRGVACLLSDSDRRGLGLYRFGDRWSSYDRFAAVRK